MFFEPLCKCSHWFSNILFITPHAVIFVSVYESTLFKDRIFVLWSHKEVLDGKSSFKMHLYHIFTTCFLNAFTQPLVVWYHQIWILVVAVVMSRIVGAFLFLFLTGAWLLILTLLRTHVAYLHLLRAWKRSSSSSCNSWGGNRWF